MFISAVGLTMIPPGDVGMVVMPKLACSWDV